jgi:hypothetical protein
MPRYPRRFKHARPELKHIDWEYIEYPAKGVLGVVTMKDGIKQGSVTDDAFADSAVISGDWKETFDHLPPKYPRRWKENDSKWVGEVMAPGGKIALVKNSYGNDCRIDCFQTEKFFLDRPSQFTETFDHLPSEPKYPRRFKHESEPDVSWYIEQKSPSSNAVTVAPGFHFNGIDWPPSYVDVFVKAGHWVEQFDHHEKCCECVCDVATLGAGTFVLTGLEFVPFVNLDEAKQEAPADQAPPEETPGLDAESLPDGFYYVEHQFPEGRNKTLLRLGYLSGRAPFRKLLLIDTPIPPDGTEIRTDCEPEFIEPTSGLVKIVARVRPPAGYKHK